MKKTLVFLCLVLTVFVSACQAPAPSPTPTQVATEPAPTTVVVPASPTPVVPTPTTTSPAAPSPTPTTSGPCTDAASFVADVTIPDYSHFDKKETFTKTWEVKNVGTCSWTTDYKAVYSHGASLGAPLSIPLSETGPGSTLNISADMAAPPTDGKFQTFYQLVNSSGQAMPIDAGDTLWTLITVGNYVQAPPPTPSAPAAPTPSGGSSGSSTGPGLATVSCQYQTNGDILAGLVTLINAQRAANNPPLPALTLNDKLSAAAQNHSEDMACNNFLQHSGWNGSTPASRIAAAGYTASITRENIYAQPPQYGGSAQTAVTWWMGDQIHRDAILDTQITEIGVGYASYPYSDLVGYFTVDFAAP